MSKPALYMIGYHEEDSPSGTTREWFTTFNKAMRRLRQLKLSDSHEVNVIEAERTKVGLASFLNIYGKNG